MVEIALSLAIIAFALVAIIGVLPAGLSVQKDNREQTIINLDAAYLMDAIRHGPLGQDNLTNYIVSLSETRYQWQGNPTNGLAGFPGSVIANYFFTTNQTVISNSPTVVAISGPFLTNGFNIIGLLGTPKYTYFSPIGGELIVWSHAVTAVFRAINAPAVDTGSSQASKDFAFQYQVTVEIARSAQSPYAAMPGDQSWANLTAPGLINVPNPTGSDIFAQALQKNLFEMRLTFRWPVLPNGRLGAGRQVFRSSVAATYLTSSPPLPPGTLGPLPLGESYYFPSGIYLFFLQPDTYAATTP